jgi:hypothetical protein
MGQGAGPSLYLNIGLEGSRRLASFSSIVFAVYYVQNRYLGWFFHVLTFFSCVLSLISLLVVTKRFAEQLPFPPKQKRIALYLNFSAFPLSNFKPGIMKLFGLTQEELESRFSAENISNSLVVISYILLSSLQTIHNKRILRAVYQHFYSNN